MTYLSSMASKATALAQRAWPEHNQASPELRDSLLARLLEEGGELAKAMRSFDGCVTRQGKPVAQLSEVADELGDVLVILLRLAYIYGIEPELAIDLALEKFEARVKTLEHKRATEKKQK